MGIQHTPNSSLRTQREVHPVDSPEGVLAALLDSHLARLEDILSRRSSGFQPKATNTQWRAVAVVLDRIFFLIFLLLNIAAIVLFFPRP